MSNDGYILDLDYIYGYFAEQSPARLELALLSRGIANQIGSNCSYLELGFGQGLTLAVNAATSEGAYYGTDFNPSQAATARRLADATGRNVSIFDDAFEEFADRTDLPQFDIIALHGIWSWVSDASRNAIIKIAKNNLKPGGIFYVSYNTNPGWSPATPMRHLLSEYSKREITGSHLSKVDQSLDFVQSLIDSNARYFVENPGLTERIQRMRQSDKTYVLHEYFNQNWHPMSFIEISERLSEAKLSFAASANLLDNIDSLSVPPQAAAVLNSLSDENLRQMTKDFFVGQQFRRDIFQKGVRHMSRGELRDAIVDKRYVLLGDPSKPPQNVTTAAGEATLLPEIYAPICDAIAALGDDAISLASISAHIDNPLVDEWKIWEALLVLNGCGWLSPRSSSADNPDCVLATQALNREILRRSKHSQEIQCLAMTATGAALPFSRIEQMLIASYCAGDSNPPVTVLSILDKDNEKILNDGAIVESSAEALVVLQDIWVALKSGKLDLLRKLGGII